jgi:hypothetical protein
MPKRDLTDIPLERIGLDASPERVDSYAEAPNTALPLLAGILVIGLAFGYVGYCFYTTGEMITEREALMKAPPPKLKR